MHLDHRLFVIYHDPTVCRRAEAVVRGGGSGRQLGHHLVHELRYDSEERGLQGDAVSTTSNAVTPETNPSQPGKATLNDTGPNGETL